jgi:hypothetical protein
MDALLVYLMTKEEKVLPSLKRNLSLSQSTCLSLIKRPRCPCCRNATAAESLKAGYVATSAEAALILQERIARNEIWAYWPCRSRRPCSNSVAECADLRLQRLPKAINFIPT